MVLTGIIDAVEVCDQFLKQGTDLHQLMPIFGGARQARHFHAEDDPDMVQADFCYEPLKALTSLGTGARPPQIFVDH
jgi:hypothetical protein